MTSRSVIMALTLASCGLHGGACSTAPFSGHEEECLEHHQLVCTSTSASKAPVKKSVSLTSVNKQPCRQAFHGALAPATILHRTTLLDLNCLLLI